MIVNAECVGCGQCVVFCPSEAISVWGRASISDNCTRCGVCVPYCPLGAIREDEA
ncbi:MAG: 4Fe-4S binding protein [ANME-2 cluster archaeon]|nr:4Fe-4S binding protein [ANME-2 cluster archaeon]MBC2701478.1 4Fe-4S binding protein [ANME-2 cluster archaeon]MBC2706877.1 4Fe-4S binding protein [ANME-2 cluster archaeon]MBC2746166.1 4Fe-4S binding protein [ANME-2 cluster archaeon]MBC2764020.1 4Fe-4S binding protein [ANME-2 cluster archaeon]